MLLAFGIGALAIAAKPALAQSGTNLNSPTVGAIRLGIYLPASSHVTTPIGKVFPGGGLDYTFQQTAQDRAQVSLDYIERSSSGSDVRVVPLTVSDIIYSGPRADFRPYWGVGAGAYFVHVNVPNPNPAITIGTPGAQIVNGTDTVFGGFLDLGLDFQYDIFVDARYHWIGEVDGVNPSGLELTAGYRF